MRTIIILLITLYLSPNSFASPNPDLGSLSCSEFFSSFTNTDSFSVANLDPAALWQNLESANTIYKKSDNSEVRQVNNFFVSEKKQKDLIELAESMGFNARSHFDNVNLLRHEIETFLRVAPLEDLAIATASLLGQIRLSDSRIKPEVRGLFLDDTLKDVIKREILSKMLKQSFLQGSMGLYNALVVNKPLVSKMGGKERLITAFFQLLLDSQVEIKQFINSIPFTFDGFLYLPGFNGKSLIVLGETNSQTTDPKQYILKANNKTPISISNVYVFKTNSNSESLFAANLNLIQADESTIASPQGIQDPVFDQFQPNDFLLKPTLINLEALAVAKTTNGEYSVIMLKGYQFDSRIANNETPHYEDLQNAIKIALADASLDVDDYIIDTHSLKAGFKISFKKNISNDKIQQFEKQLVYRVLELRNLKEARASNYSDQRPDVTIEDYHASEYSGFTTLEDAATSINYDSKINKWGWYYYTLKEITSKRGTYGLYINYSLLDTESTIPGQTELKEARENPMTPTSMGSGYIVFKGTTALKSDETYNIGVFYIFKTLNQAREFVRTHRFTPITH